MNCNFTLRLNMEPVLHTVVELGSVSDCIAETDVK